jgi:hypothetical protein
VKSYPWVCEVRRGCPLRCAALPPSRGVSHGARGAATVPRRREDKRGGEGWRCVVTASRTRRCTRGRLDREWDLGQRIDFRDLRSQGRLPRCVRSECSHRQPELASSGACVVSNLARHTRTRRRSKYRKIWVGLFDSGVCCCCCSSSSSRSICTAWRGVAWHGMFMGRHEKNRSTQMDSATSAIDDSLRRIDSQFARTHVDRQVQGRLRYVEGRMMRRSQAAR